MKYCVNCGDQVDGDASFCSSCGYKQPTSLVESSPHPPISTSFIPIQQTQPKKKKYSKDNITDTIGCILLIGGIIVLLILYSIFQELADLIIGIIVAIIVISCIFRLIFGSIGEVVSRRKKKKVQDQNMKVE